MVLIFPCVFDTFVSDPPADFRDVADKGAAPPGFWAGNFAVEEETMVEEWTKGIWLLDRMEFMLTI
jgi:hypothetical protein